MKNIKIERVELSDISLLKTIGKQTFIETFSETNTEEDMKAYLQKGFSDEKLIKEINNPDSQFYFAILDNNIVGGYLKINFNQAQTELKDNTSLEIERIYVLKEFQGSKLGQFLFNKALDIAKESRLSYLWLGVWEENTNAIKFYKKNSFVEFDKHVFKLGNDEQIDIMMKLKL